MKELLVGLKLKPETADTRSRTKYLEFFQSVLGNQASKRDFSENYQTFWEFTKRLQDAKVHPQKVLSTQSLDFQSGKYRSPQTKIAKQFLQMMLSIQATLKHEMSLNIEEIDQIFLFILGQIDIHISEKLLFYFTNGKYNLQDLLSSSFLYEQYFVDPNNPKNREFVMDTNQALHDLSGLHFCMVYYQALASFRHPAIASQLPDLIRQRNELSSLSIDTLKKIIATYPKVIEI